ncbi:MULTISPECIES: hypothetical protein [Pelosinus]|jgi:hypothetical protein|uniref:Uncharacterized protein n=1 Tax=Pelosinus fermentans B4 TaxID=1149862 RepID=I9AR82_9FIRM|nr:MULTISPECIES: hypothetical protein [Pelosinus]EIW15457.1 hypothetical protein FB4_1146 [Pelosinus fermentans B4]EIW26852.1 hypothetical protein FA11_1856 [Pelosinus fermentans A11]OAM92199.1 hypothetical protein FR7_00215 [Pelosinus fermentans DSM 17108]SDQ36608.1 hypothetical protein SAMN04515679_0258 [Pelosinus fermentans]
MKPTTICEQLESVIQKLTSIKASDIDSVEDAFKDLLHCETNTMKLYDEIKGEILRVHSEEVTDEEFRQKMNLAVKKIISN